MLLDRGSPPLPLQSLDIRRHMHRLHVFEAANSLPFAPAEEGAGSPPVSGASVGVADVDGEELDEAPGGALACPGDERWKRRPRRVSNGSERSFCSRRCYSLIVYRACHAAPRRVSPTVNRTARGVKKIVGHNLYVLLISPSPCPPCFSFLMSQLFQFSSRSCEPHQCPCQMAALVRTIPGAIPSDEAGRLGLSCR